MLTSTAPAPRVLIHDDLRRLAPSVFATAPYRDVSDRYRFMPTAEILDMLADRGFRPVRAMQSRTRLPDKCEFTKHLIRLRHDEFLRPTAVGEELPELVLTNSHDRSSAYRFASGIFRLVCSNGLVVASANFGDVSVKHSGAEDLPQRVIDATYEIVEETPLVMSQVETFKQIALDRPRQLAFAAAALETRDSDAKIEPAEVLRAQRREDHAAPDGTRSLWGTLNVVQERLVKGGVRGRSESGRRMTTRPIKGVDADLKTNRALWRLAEEMAKLA